MENEGQVCAPCLAQPPDHDGARAAVTYDEVARTIILKLKHGRRIGLAGLIGQAMARHVPSGPVLLVPVPLHRWRMWRRGFNQSALIGRVVSKAIGQPLALDLLRRVKATPLLGGLGAKARATTVRGAFIVDPAQSVTLKGATVILIDDVYTSGATSNACARALKKGGAARVIILCWARVLRGGSVDH